MKQKKSPIQVPDGLSTVLLHACCAPCSSAIVEWMLAHGVIPTIYYYNPNIFPREEYDIRKEESKRHAESLGLKWIDGDYNHEHWLENVCGLEQEPERGRRCDKCFFVRLLAAARKARELGVNYFTTTLASSRWKNLEQINQAGLLAQDQVPGVVYWSQNWRKGGLSDRRNQLLREYGFYNQQYCGCEFSMRKEKEQKMTDNNQELFPLVDESGLVVGSATRGECHNGSRLLHPVVHLHVFNSQGEVYLQKRPAWKDIQPGKWDTAVGGHVDYGETPEEALQREVREELGISDFMPEYVGQYVFDSQRERELVYVNRTTYDGPVNPSAEELDGGRFWSISDIQSALGKGILTPNFESEFARFFL